MTNKEIAEELSLNPESDPTGFEGFMITEDYASVFAGLLGAYSNLIIRTKTADGTPEVNRVAYEKRFMEIGILKNHMQTSDLKTMRNFTVLYVQELSEIQDLLKNK